MYPKLARTLSENKTQNTRSSLIKVAVTKICNVFLAHPASNMPTLNTVNFVATFNLFQGYFARSAPRICYLIYLEFVKIYILSFFFDLVTFSTRMRLSFTLETHFYGATRTNHLVLTTTARFLNYSVAIGCQTPHFLFVERNILIGIQDLVLFENLWRAQLCNLFLSISCLLRASYTHTRKSSSFTLSYV